MFGMETPPPTRRLEMECIVSLTDVVVFKPKPTLIDDFDQYMWD
jgi:hypothetical protein